MGAAKDKARLSKAQDKADGGMTRTQKAQARVAAAESHLEKVKKEYASINAALLKHKATVTKLNIHIARLYKQKQKADVAFRMTSSAQYAVKQKDAEADTAWKLADKKYHRAVAQQEG